MSVKQKRIKRKGYEVAFEGDESVGIFPSYWTISGDIEFDEGQVDQPAEEQERDFLEAIKDAFELITGERCAVIPFPDRSFDSQGSDLDSIDEVRAKLKKFFCDYIEQMDFSKDLSFRWLSLLKRPDVVDLRIAADGEMLERLLLLSGDVRRIRQDFDSQNIKND